jgi:hypothetical protein
MAWKKKQKKQKETWPEQSMEAGNILPTVSVNNFFHKHMLQLWNNQGVHLVQVHNEPPVFSKARGPRQKKKLVNK